MLSNENNNKLLQPFGSIKHKLQAKQNAYKDNDKDKYKKTRYAAEWAIKTGKAKHHDKLEVTVWAKIVFHAAVACQEDHFCHFSFGILAGQLLYFYLMCLEHITPHILTITLLLHV